MEIVSSIVSEVVKLMISPIINPIKYLTGHENNVQSLKTRVERLKDARQRVQRDIDAAKRHREEIHDDVNKWLTTVDKTIAEEVENVMQDEDKAKKKCFVGLCPNLWACYKHSVKAEEEAKAVAELLEQGKFNGVSYPVAPQGITAAAVKGFETFESRTLVLNGIMEALKDDRISVIGVHGMGGVGKTTLVKEVARQVKEAKLFHSVVIATVTQNLDLKNIQNQIADLLGLKFEEQSMVGRALRLREKLKKEKNILVVLDDLWAALDLDEIGIPSGHEHEGCKILLTSRDRNVLSSGMDTQKDFAVGLLNEEEAWDLFKKMAGECVESCDLQSTAIEVAKKCAGLPIAIATVARALRSKSSPEWKNALRELERPSPGNFTGITAAVYSAIELSYSYLESEEIKLTFLLCSLIGHNGFVEDLLRYTMGWGLFDRINTTEEARAKVLSVVSNLKASCLLLDSNSREQFDIHDVVWDVAISIASRDHHMFVLRSGDVLKEWPRKEIMNSCSAISLLNPRIIGELKLPDEMECPQLSFFSMYIDGSVQIPANFFRGTERLKVLDFTGMHFQSLPESINLQTNLQTLRLNGCTLEDITIVGKLKNLEILSLAKSDIKTLPKEIAQLSRLRLLDLNNCTKLEIVPPDVLSSLSKLEELYIENSFVEWKDGALGNQRRNASLDELKQLPHLTTLYAHIPDAQIIPKHLFLETLDRYRILIGDVRDSFQYKYLRTLRFKLYTSMGHGIKILWKKSEDLYLDRLKGIKNVLAELNNGEDCPDLKRLRIKDGLEVQYIATENNKFTQLQSLTLHGLPQLISFCSEENRYSSSHQKEVAMSSKPLPLFNKQLVFPQLESLELSSLNAERIWHSPLSETCSFAAKLTSLIIKGCGNLKHLFSPSIARSLVNQLTNFEIEECQCLREIISIVEIEEEKVVICFSRLNSLKIRNLRNLVKFCSGEYNIEFPSLKVLEIQDCPALKEFINEPKADEICQLVKRALFSDKLVFPQLESLKLSSIKAERIWQSQLSETRWAANLKSLIIDGCGSLEHLLSPSIASSLVQLTQFGIGNCKCLREIISSHEMERQDKDGICFPQLNSLTIRDLGNLVNFCGGNYNIEFPSLKVLKLDRCPVLKEFINEPEMEEKCLFSMPALFNKKVALPSLERLRISDLKTMKMIFRTQLLSAGSFCKLKEISVQGCDELLTIFPAKTFGVFQSLEELRVWGCYSLELIFETLKHVCNRDPQGMLTFQTLRKVDIYNCMNLKNLFPVSIANDLPQLEHLEVDDCGLEEIVSAGEVLEENIGFKFAQVSSLVLKNLKELKCFYPGQHTIVWPMLKKLEITGYSTLLKIGIQDVNGNNAPHSGAGQPLFLVEKVIPMLKQLRLTNCSDDISKICDSGFLRRFYNLESLEFSYCDFKDLASSEGADAEKPDAVTLSRVKKLTLTSPKSLEHIWKKDSELGHILPTLEILKVIDCDDLIKFGLSSASFQNLTTLKVEWCKRMINLITPSVVKNLVQLTTMRIKLCSRMTEIVANKGDEATDEITFRMLKCLELYHLRSLASFCSGNYSIKFPCLQELIVYGCRSLKIFSKGVISSPQLGRVKESSNDRKGHWAGDLNTTIQQLYTEEVGYDLQLSDTVPELMEKWNGRNPQQDLDFKSLTRLEVCKCSSNLKLNYILTLSMAFSLNRLEVLVVKECSTLNDVIVEQEGTEEDLATTHNNFIIFPRLYYIEIGLCPNLISLYLGSRALEFPSLGTISIADCPKMATFGSSYSRDKEREVSGDGREKRDLNFAPFFSDKAVCPKLWRLKLSSVNIQMMWDHQQLPSSSSCFQKLKELSVKGCHNLKYLFPSFMLKHFVQLKRLDICECKIMEEVIFMEGLTEDERMSPMLFPLLNSLKLKDLPKLSRFCCENYFEFPSLESLTLENCSLLKTFLSKETENAQGNKVELSALFNEKVALPLLKYLTIQCMQSCRKIWPDQITVKSFLQLVTVEVKSCEKLLNIFPLNMMERLENLSRLQIVDCDSLEEIVEPQAVIANQSHAVASAQSVVEETVTKFVFPNVTYLLFEKLPKLKSFYSRVHATKWPTLEKMEVIECHNVQIFASECPGLGETHAASQAEISNRQPLFRVNEVTFPVLEELKLTLNDTWHGEVLSTECFRRLKVLELTCVPQKSTTLSHFFFPSLPNLEIKLVLKDASSSQIFQFDGLSNDERHASALTRLSELRLSKLPELTHLWKEEFQPTTAFCGLKILELLDCGKLKTLAPYLVSFNNLMTLEVSGCHGFINLMTCSTAKCLMQLKRMSIIDCENIEEIIACDADEMEGAIVFSHLKYLQLGWLPNLASFCLGNNSLEFPALRKVIVRECRKLKIFCPEDLSTPKLRQVQLTGDDEDKCLQRWEGDLKTTIRQLFEGMNVQSSEVPEV